MSIRIPFRSFSFYHGEDVIKSLYSSALCISVFLGLKHLAKVGKFGYILMPLHVIQCVLSSCNSMSDDVTAVTPTSHMILVTGVQVRHRSSSRRFNSRCLTFNPFRPNVWKNITGPNAPSRPGKVTRKTFQLQRRFCRPSFRKQKSKGVSSSHLNANFSNIKLLTFWLSNRNNQ